MFLLLPRTRFSCISQCLGLLLDTIHGALVDLQSGDHASRCVPNSNFEECAEGTNTATM